MFQLSLNYLVTKKHDRTERTQRTSLPRYRAPHRSNLPDRCVSYRFRDSVSPRGSLWCTLCSRRVCSPAPQM